MLLQMLLSYKPMENLRVCGDCHAAIKMVTEAYGTEIGRAHV